MSLKMLSVCTGCPQLRTNRPNYHQEALYALLRFVKLRRKFYETSLTYEIPNPSGHRFCCRRSDLSWLLSHRPQSHIGSGWACHAQASAACKQSDGRCINLAFRCSHNTLSSMASGLVTAGVLQDGIQISRLSDWSGRSPSCFAHRWIRI
ncbi:hypothetical protein CB0940_04136 [Cercospora beticola]|uniref:Uncharacterized protein n=1 Tax=Cercospora beticola TaxID=122368 RepID=A0A2G5HLA1_CERBT|nr:hypothetical protein CB0940_04136 [Cercospora beticola]PIA92993.1 hypothetical protein CB0940_04136 [Cercospora beticola]